MAAVPKPVRAEKEIKGNSLQRKTPLTAKKGLQSKSKLKARPNGGRSYNGLYKRGYCGICGKWLGVENTAWHHITYRSQGGDESDGNLIEVGFGMPWICDCHDRIHSGKISKAEVLAARARLGSYRQGVAQ